MALQPGVGSGLGAGLVGVTDMCLLDTLDEDSFLSNLQERFNHDQIYTYIGNVVISVNPYRKLPLYSQDVIFEYRSRNIYELPPHIYAVVDDAYREMRDHNLDQCVIISGESGAGKTEASKVIMQYVAAASGKGQDIDRVKEQLLQSNPVLEAYGNAKTHRNDNSSRFGKYMDIEFDFKGDPVGGAITNYLLEKSRVVEQSEGERNFHIFYQLLRGAEDTFLESLKLRRSPEEYAILQAGGDGEVDTIDDGDDYQATRRAMEVIGFEESEIRNLFYIVAIVLKLGNASFTHRGNFDGTDGCTVDNEEELEEVSELLGCSSSQLTKALTERVVNTGKDKVKADLSATEASYARDALCKALYSRLFTWLVRRINESIKVTKTGRQKSMGVLDIYGFEIFEHNSFEQFIINYCNEKLQQIFIELTLKEEQEEYISEGIEWISVDYFNNAVICELIEKNNEGILAMLDDECLRPGKVTDMTFLAKLNVECCKHPHYESRGCRKTQSDKSLPHDAFKLIHYAGAVLYRVNGFIDKNNDLLFRDLSRAMYECENPLLHEFFPEGSNVIPPDTGPPDTCGPGDPARVIWRRPPTAGSQFKVSVGKLMENLLSKSPNYIRCIKPNDFKKANMFDETIVRHQVRYLGLMENVRVRRAGYAFRQKYEVFLYRYKMLSETTWPHWYGSPAKGVQEIFTYLNVAEEEVAFGKTKIFIKNPRTLFAMEEQRLVKIHILATLLQKIYRGWKQRQRYLRLRAAEISIARFYRGYAARQRYKKVCAATLVICSYARGWKARKLLRQLREEKRRLLATIVMQKFCRGWKARKLLRQLREEKRRLVAAIVMQKFCRGWKVRKEFRRKFRAIAGPKIIRFMKQVLKFMYLEKLRRELPTLSPLDDTWPDAPSRFKATSQHLKQMYHQWRCRKYRLQLDKVTKKKLQEKLVASDLFKDKKANYAESVPQPFRGDYVSLHQNEKWKKVMGDTPDFTFADIIMKVNRKNGKMVPQLLVMTNTVLLILDHHSLAVKYRVPMTEVDGISLSPFNDHLVIFHITRPENGGNGMKKGDFLFSSDHVIEIVAKLFLQVEGADKVDGADTKKPQIQFGTKVITHMNKQSVEVSFLDGVPNILPGSVAIQRRGNIMSILQS